MMNRALWTLLLVLGSGVALAADAVCVRIRLVIPQRLTMERDAFDASLELTNNLTDAPLESLDIAVRFRTLDDLPADGLFFLRPTAPTGISGGIEGAGVIAPSGRGSARWLIIPTVGAGGITPGGQQYFVKATLQYRVNGNPFTTETYEELITVQPQPELVLDYALPRQVKGDDPFTPEAEPVVPFELAMRVSNVGAGAARNLRVVSAQPRIIENLSGALIDFQIVGTFRDDESIANTLAIPFGNLQPGTCGMGAWAMTASLQGEFTEMSATFEHREDLGGALTSLIREARTNWLVHRIQMDIPGRDNVPDALVDLATSNDGLPDQIQDSQCGEQPVTVVPATVSGVPDAQNPTVLVTATVQPQWIYFTVPDPGAGRYPIRRVERIRDGRVLHTRNGWLHEDTTVDPPTPQLAFVDFSQFGGVPEVYRVTLDFSEFDVTPPVSFLDPLPPFVSGNPLYVTPTTVLLVRALDDLSGVARTEYRRDGGPWRAAAPFYIAAPGPHLVEFRSLDVRGNQEAIQAVTVHVDADPPQVTVLSPTPGATYLRGQSITVDVTTLDLDPNPTVTMRLRPTGGGDALPILDGQVLSADTLAVGSYVVEIEALDWLGQAASSTTLPFLVQETPGGCVNVPDGVLCDDGNPCTVQDTCLASACGGVVNTCDDGNSCTADRCELPTGCINTPDNQASCDDANACTASDACVDGACLGAAVTCEDNNPCTNNTCDPAVGCVVTPNTNACDDGNACTSNDTCGGGTCAGTALACDDNNTCTSDSCSPATGCVYAPAAGSCDDNNACTTNDTCANGTCSGGVPLAEGTGCDDGDPCTQDTACNAAGQCSGTAVLCGSGNTCSPSMCCGTSPVDCNDNNDCTQDVCGGDGGCAHLDRCGDGGLPSDGGVVLDGSAGDSGTRDGGPLLDAGVGSDAAVGDASTPGDGGRRDSGTGAPDGSTVLPGVDAGGGGGEEPPPRCGCGVTNANSQDPLAAVVLLCAGLVLGVRRRR